MATLPSYVCIEQGAWVEGFNPSVERSEMERGPPKERRINTLVQADVTATFVFKRRQDAIAFEDWYFQTLGRIGWFEMTHPLRQTTITARFIAGDIGQLQPRGRGFEVSSRQVRLEYMR